MAVRAAAIAFVVLSSLVTAHGAVAQSPAKPLTDDALREMLVWNSPWNGRATNPGGFYSFRHVFRQRREALVAEVTSLSTNQRSDSVVSIRDGALSWQDSAGADVNVVVGASGELVGTAKSRDASVSIVLTPRP